MDMLKVMPMIVDEQEINEEHREVERQPDNAAQQIRYINIDLLHIAVFIKELLHFEDLNGARSTLHEKIPNDDAQEKVGYIGRDMLRDHNIESYKIDCYVG
jgi:hypothetical protein